MSRQRPDLLGQAILYTVASNVRRFRFVHGCILVGLGLALVGAVACQGLWLPRWPTYILAVLLVLDALMHARINRAYSEGEVRAWQQVLGLADSVMNQARIDAATRPKPTKKPTMTPYGPKPPFRVVRPDDEPPANGRD
jgi:hypothetical protein